MATDLNVSAMEDRLRAMELDISSLKRRQPTGVEIEYRANLWVAPRGPGPPPPPYYMEMGPTVNMTHEGWYVRVNNIVFTRSRHYFDPHGGAWPTGNWYVPFPFPIVSCSGQWTMGRRGGGGGSVSPFTPEGSGYVTSTLDESAVGADPNPLLGKLAYGYWESSFNFNLQKLVDQVSPFDWVTPPVGGRIPNLYISTTSIVESGY